MEESNVSENIVTAPPSSKAPELKAKLDAPELSAKLDVQEKKDTNLVRTLPTPITIESFDFGVTLGTGSFGRVKFAVHKVSS